MEASSIGIPISTDRVPIARAIRAGLLLRGHTLSSWCAERRVSPAWVRQALCGKRTGPAARAIMRDLMRDAGLSS